MLASAFEIPDSDFQSAVSKAQNFDEALDLLAEVIFDMGFTQAAYAYIPTSPKLLNGDWLPLKLRIRQYPKGWQDGWNQFMRVDPYYRSCFNGTLPIDWGEVQLASKLDGNISPVQREAFAYMADFGLSRGITVPVHLPFHGHSVMSAVADSSCANWDAVRARAFEPLFHIAHIFTNCILQSGYECEINTSLPVKLTQREQECLSWVGAGKTSVETALILGCSMENVRFHVKNAIRKLGVSNRAQAVAEAVRLGLI